MVDKRSKAEATAVAAKAWTRTGPNLVRRETEKWKAVSMPWLDNEIVEVKEYAARIRNEILKRDGQYHECPELLQAFEPYVKVIDTRMQALMLFADDSDGFDKMRKDVAENRLVAPVPDFEHVESRSALRAKADGFGGATALPNLKQLVGAAKQSLKIAKLFLQDIQTAIRELANAKKVRERAARNTETQKVKAQEGEAKKNFAKG